MENSTLQIGDLVLVKLPEMKYLIGIISEKEIRADRWGSYTIEWFHDDYSFTKASEVWAGALRTNYLEWKVNHGL